MIEIPEAVNLSRQMGDVFSGKVVAAVTAGGSPHKFAWLYGDAEGYAALAVGCRAAPADAVAGFARLSLGDALAFFSEGMSVLYHAAGTERVKKHQLLIEFDDGSALSASARMYGGAGIVPAPGPDNPYYRVSLEKPSPLGDGFSWEHFATIAEAAAATLSAKALLATEQRIPGLGNGVLQDILFRAGIHPKRKISALDDRELRTLHESVRSTLREMTEAGGRDTESDLFGAPGGYATLMSRLTVGTPCTVCGTPVEKAAHMGGSVHFCPVCEPL